MFLLYFISLILFNSSLYCGANNLIKSDWVLEETPPPQVSAIEVETRERRIRELEEAKRKHEEDIQAEKERNKERRQALLTCFKEKGVVLYSKEDCPECKEQKAIFGDDFSQLKYVDCGKARATCPLNGINTYPTWYLGSKLGIKKKGVKDLKTLSRLTGCPL